MMKTIGIALTPFAIYGNTYYVNLSTDDAAATKNDEVAK
jgi:hypothetical protein